MGKTMQRSVQWGCAAVLGLASAAFAGERSHQPVYVDTVNRTAGGAFGTARNSADSKQSLICAVAYYPSPTGWCIATDANGKTGMCVTADPNLLQGILSVKGDSAISFNWDSKGFCTYLDVETQSRMEPKL